MNTDSTRQQGFIDRVRIHVRAGNGGDGCLSFRREKFIPNGGPNGGNGGKGGDIYLQVDRNLTTLVEVSYHPHIRGKDGSNGSSYNKEGLSGEDITVFVPCGTVVKKDGRVFADLTEHGRRLLIAKGGQAGRGNLAFKTHANTAPKIAEQGDKGEAVEMELELKVLADAGLLGFPNAGKSTLLSRVSSARPKIAAYPFTTLNPNLGMVYHKRKSFVIADIPGIIEGAHEGKGLGTQFLRHIERTRVLIHLVDPHGFGETGALKSVDIIMGELKQFNPKLASTPRIIVVNKSDIPEAAEVYAKLKKRYRTRKIFLMSAVTGEGVNEVLDEAVRLLETIPVRREKTEAAPQIAYHSVEPAFRLARARDGSFLVTGTEVTRIVEMTKFSQPEAVIRTMHLFHRIGLDKALLKQGVREGDTVRIAGLEFEWSQSDFLPSESRKASRRSR